MLKKLKSIVLDDTMYIAFLLVLTAVCSFGLGKLSVIQNRGVEMGISKPATIRSFMGPNSLTSIQTQDNQKAILMATSAATVLQVVATETQSLKNFVASKSGTKYHAMHCSGTKTIKETNKIYFATEDEAQAAGYTRSANCKFRTVTE